MNSSQEFAEKRRELTKILSRYRDPELAKKIVEKIHDIASRIDKEKILLMSFCGTHEHTVTYYGIRSLMPDKIELVAGPGCPVCVTPARIIDTTIKLALEEDVIIQTYGDMYKVPGSKQSLANARSMGARVEIVYGFNDAIRKAKQRKDEEHVFIGVGFETTMPTVASYIYSNRMPDNLYILPSYRLTPPITEYMLQLKDIAINGIILPGHVSTIIGVESWLFLEGRVPSVIAGFEPIDVLIAILMILRQILRDEARVENEYTRVVKFKGNEKARKIISRVFEVIDADWRGIGVVPKSGATFRDVYKKFNALEKYSVEVKEAIDIRPGCKCTDIVLGLAKPTDCPLFLKACTPERPYGPCMVSSEGTCHIWAKYGSYLVNK